MKHRKEIIITIIITTTICFVAIPLGVNYAFHHVAPVDILAARWEASDALNYIATTLAFIGTFFLGLVAWKQNTDLQKIETNRFIADNSCEVFLESIQLKNLDQTVCNLKTQHMESIVVEEGIQGCNYGSLQIEICLKRKSGYATQVRVNDMRLLSQRIPTENTFIITLSTTPLHWTAPENSGIFCCPGWRCSD